MSATDRIRARVDKNDYRLHDGTRISAPVPLTADEMEALCDLADAARRWFDAAESMHINDVACAEFDMRVALARLDGEGQ